MATQHPEAWNPFSGSPESAPERHLRPVPRSESLDPPQYTRTGLNSMLGPSHRMEQRFDPKAEWRRQMHEGLNAIMALQESMRDDRTRQTAENLIAQQMGDEAQVYRPDFGQHLDEEGGFSEAA